MIFRSLRVLHSLLDLFLFGWYYYLLSYGVEKAIVRHFCPLFFNLSCLVQWQLRDNQEKVKPTVNMGFT